MGLPINFPEDNTSTLIPDTYKHNPGFVDENLYFHYTTLARRTSSYQQTTNRSSTILETTSKPLRKDKHTNGINHRFSLISRLWEQNNR